MSENHYTNMTQPSGPDRNKWVYIKMNTKQEYTGYLALKSQNSQPEIIIEELNRCSLRWIIKCYKKLTKMFCFSGYELTIWF